MTLIDRLTHDIADAMKAHEQVRLSALRMAKAALMNGEVAKGARSKRPRRSRCSRR